MDEEGGGNVFIGSSLPLQRLRVGDRLGRTGCILLLLRCHLSLPGPLDQLWFGRSNGASHLERGKQENGYKRRASVGLLAPRRLVGIGVCRKEQGKPTRDPEVWPVSTRLNSVQSSHFLQVVSKGSAELRHCHQQHHHHHSWEQLLQTPIQIHCFLPSYHTISISFGIREALLFVSYLTFRLVIDLTLLGSVVVVVAADLQILLVAPVMIGERLLHRAKAKLANLLSDLRHQSNVKNPSSTANKGDKAQVCFNKTSSCASLDTWGQARW